MMMSVYLFCLVWCELKLGFCSDGRLGSGSEGLGDEFGSF